MKMIPTGNPLVGVQGFLWGEDVLVIPEYCFGVLVHTKDIILSDEHVEFRWSDYETALGLLKWESNRNALWELNYRLSKQYKFPVRWLVKKPLSPFQESSIHEVVFLKYIWDNSEMVVFMIDSCLWNWAG